MIACGAQLTLQISNPNSELQISLNVVFSFTTVNKHLVKSVMHLARSKNYIKNKKYKNFTDLNTKLVSIDVADVNDEGGEI